MVYGIPVGEPGFVSSKLRDKAQEIVDDASKAVQILKTNRQSLWTALRLSISQRFTYFLQLSPPSLTEPVADWLDTELWRLLEVTCGFTIPKGPNRCAPQPQKRSDNGGESTFGRIWRSSSILYFLRSARLTRWNERRR